MCSVSVQHAAEKGDLCPENPSLTNKGKKNSQKIKMTVLFLMMASVLEGNVCVVFRENRFHVKALPSVFHKP